MVSSLHTLCTLATNNRKGWGGDSGGGPGPPLLMSYLKCKGTLCLWGVWPLSCGFAPLMITVQNHSDIMHISPPMMYNFWWCNLCPWKWVLPTFSYHLIPGYNNYTTPIFNIPFQGHCWDCTSKVLWAPWSEHCSYSLRSSSLVKDLKLFHR